MSFLTFHFFFLLSSFQLNLQLFEATMQFLLSALSKNTMTWPVHEKKQDHAIRVVLKTDVSIFPSYLSRVFLATLYYFNAIFTVLS